MVGKVVEVTSLADFQKIINEDKPAVFDFWATWCGPCRIISPIFEKLSEKEEFSGIGFYKVDVDNASDIAEEVGVRAMPTFIAFQKGNKVKDLVGAHPTQLEALVSSLVAAV